MLASRRYWGGSFVLKDEETVVLCLNIRCAYIETMLPVLKCPTCCCYFQGSGLRQGDWKGHWSRARLPGSAARVTCPLGRPQPPWQRLERVRHLFLHPDTLSCHFLLTAAVPPRWSSWWQGPWPVRPHVGGCPACLGNQCLMETRHLPALLQVPWMWRLSRPVHCMK